VTVLLLRHASAGARERWSGDDRLRPLDARGCRQAEALVAALAGRVVTQVLSSPFLRCVQTVQPLAAARGLAVETREELAEGSPREAVLALVAGCDGAVLCTHGDVVEAVLGEELPKGGGCWLDGAGRPLERLEPQA
jgi:phosphohistidine phosphatase SixA